MPDSIITKEDFMNGTIGTAIVLLILAVIIFFVIRSMVKDKKNGKSLQCGGDCKKCKGCH